MLLSSLKFGSFLTYSPHGTDLKALESQLLRKQVKSDFAIKDHEGNRWITSIYLAKRLAQELYITPLTELLGRDVALVPAPGSSRTPTAGLRVPLRISQALVDEGLGSEVVDIIERAIAVAKSAYSPAEKRPKAKEHYESMLVKQLRLGSFSRMVIVDDFITRGATLLAAASILAESYPDAKIEAFAMVRTISNPQEFRKIIDPCIGEITRKGQETHRVP